MKLKKRNVKILKCRILYDTFVISVRKDTVYLYPYCKCTESWQKKIGKRVKNWKKICFETKRVHSVLQLSVHVARTGGSTTRKINKKNHLFISIRTKGSCNQKYFILFLIEKQNIKIHLLKPNRKIENHNREENTTKYTHTTKVQSLSKDKDLQLPLNTPPSTHKSNWNQNRNKNHNQIPSPFTHP